MDCRDAPRDGYPGVDFSREGSDDCDPASGRDWAALKADGLLHGHIYFHLAAPDVHVSARRALHVSCLLGAARWGRP